MRSDIEYEVNVKAELEVAHLHEKTDQIYTHMLDHFGKLERKINALTASESADNRLKH